MKSNSIFIKCHCSSHMLECEKFDEGHGDSGFYLSNWHYGHNGNLRNWKERLRWSWRILTTGNPWTDSIVLTDSNAKKLSKFINDRIKQVDSNSKTE